MKHTAGWIWNYVIDFAHHFAACAGKTLSAERVAKLAFAATVIGVCAWLGALFGAPLAGLGFGSILVSGLLSKRIIDQLIKLLGGRE